MVLRQVASRGCFHGEHMVRIQPDFSFQPQFSHLVSSSTEDRSLLFNGSQRTSFLSLAEPLSAKDLAACAFTPSRHSDGCKLVQVQRKVCGKPREALLMKHQRSTTWLDLGSGTVHTPMNAARTAWRIRAQLDKSRPLCSDRGGGRR